MEAEERRYNERWRPAQKEQTEKNAPNKPPAQLITQRRQHKLKRSLYYTVGTQRNFSAMRTMTLPNIQTLLNAPGVAIGPWWSSWWSFSGVVAACGILWLQRHCVVITVEITSSQGWHCLPRVVLPSGCDTTCSWVSGAVVFPLFPCLKGSLLLMFFVGPLLPSLWLLALLLLSLMWRGILMCFLSNWGLQ